MPEADERAERFCHSALSFAEYDDLVAMAYAGTQEEVPWTRLLEALRDRLDANYVCLILRSLDYGEAMQLVFAGEARPAFVQSFAAELSATDPLVNLVRNRVTTLEELIDESAWLDSTYYRVFHQPLNNRFHLGVDIGSGPEPSCRLRITRPHGASRFGARERAICNLLLHHLDAAVQLRASLDIADVERWSYFGMLDRMSVGVLLLDNKRRILRMNTVAQQLIAQRDGLLVADGTLAAALPGENHQLRKLFNEVLEKRGGTQSAVLSSMSLSRPSGKSTYGVLVRAVPPTEWSEPSVRPAVMVIVRDPDAPVLASDEQLRSLYGFTAAEASLAIELMSGSSVEEAANALGVSRNTVRCQIRALFAKTGVTRQAELLRVLLSGVAPLG